MHRPPTHDNTTHLRAVCDVHQVSSGCLSHSTQLHPTPQKRNKTKNVKTFFFFYSGHRRRNYNATAVTYRNVISVVVTITAHGRFMYGVGELVVHIIAGRNDFADKMTALLLPGRRRPRVYHNNNNSSRTNKQTTNRQRLCPFSLCALARARASACNNFGIEILNNNNTRDLNNNSSSSCGGGANPTPLPAPHRSSLRALVSTRTTKTTA